MRDRLMQDSLCGGGCLSCREALDTDRDGYLDSVKFQNLVRITREQQVVVAAEAAVNGTVAEPRAAAAAVPQHNDIMVEDCEEAVR